MVKDKLIHFDQMLEEAMHNLDYFRLVSINPLNGFAVPEGETCKVVRMLYVNCEVDVIVAKRFSNEIHVDMRNTADFVLMRILEYDKLTNTYEVLIAGEKMRVYDIDRILLK